jgi:hypothetical protein
MRNGAELVELKKAIQSGARLTDEQVRKLADLRRTSNVDRRFVRVGKLALREGEELMDFVHAMIGAVMTDRIVLADGSLDAWLEGIFEDHVIVRDANTGRLFKAPFERGEDGSIAFAEPVEVRVTFVEIPRAEEGGEGAEKAVHKAAPDRIVEIEKRAPGKWGFLPTAFRGR